MSDESRLTWTGDAEGGAAEHAEARMGELAVMDTRRALFGAALDQYNPSALVTRKGLKIFDDMRMDDQVKAALTFKKLAVLSPGWEIVSPEGESEEWEPAAFVRDQLDNNDGAFDEILFQVLSALDFGYSVGEMVYEPIESGDYSGLVGLDTIRAKRPHDFDFASDKFGRLMSNGLIQRSTDKGDVNLPITKFVIWAYQQEFSNYYGRSDLEACYRPWWIKRNAYQWLAMLLERFGIPPLFALYNPAGLSKQQVADLLTVLKRLQSATSGAIPRRDKDALELWSPELAGNATRVFMPALNMLNQDISRAILMPELIGMTGGNSERGSFARSQTQFGSFALIVKHLQRQLAGAVVNAQIVKRLVDINFTTNGSYPIFRFMPMTDDQKISMLKVWNELLGTGGVAADPADETHIRRVFGMPTRSTEQPELTPPPAPDTGSGPAPSPESEEETGETEEEAVEAQYQEPRKPNRYEKRVDFSAIKRDLDTIESNALDEIVPLMADVRDRFLKAVETSFKGDTDFAARLGELRGMPKVRNAIGTYLEALYEGGRASVRSELESAVELAAEPTYRPADAVRWLKAKKFWIAGVINDKLTQEARGVLLQSIATGESVRETMDRLRELFVPYLGDPGVVRDGRVVTPWRLETITRTNAADAFNLGRIVEARRAGDMVWGFEYSAILDERTTEVCRRLDEKVFRRDDPNLQKLRPPRHYNCRSVLVPLTNDIEVDESDLMTAEDVTAGVDLSGKDFGGRKSSREIQPRGPRD